MIPGIGEATVSLAGLVVLVMALSQWIKTKLSLQNRTAEIASAVVGFVIGAGYWVANHPITSFPDVFNTVIVGAGLVLVPSGSYKLIMQFRNGSAAPSDVISPPSVSAKKD